MQECIKSHNKCTIDFFLALVEAETHSFLTCVHKELDSVD